MSGDVTGDIGSGDVTGDVGSGKVTGDVGSGKATGDVGSGKATGDVGSGSSERTGGSRVGELSAVCNVVMCSSKKRISVIHPIECFSINILICNVHCNNHSCPLFTCAFLIRRPPLP